MNIVVGTAGHIDHGKTALIKALTGIDADRLPEEKQRGISIDLGFAELELGGIRIGFIDVPGHERFIKNMLAGASGIDLVLFVIAADEGVMPQTREHFEICRLLAVGSGLIVLTKSDIVDEQLLEMAKLEAAELVENSFLDGSPIIAVSAKTGEGIDDLKRALIDAANNTATRNDEFVTRLPIDRSFTVKGFGTVVTGTLASGKICLADEMELSPTGRKVRVRGLQTHGKDVESVTAGQRAAVNLGGVDHEAITRGMVLAERGVLLPTQIIDVEVEILRNAKKPLRSRQRVRLHLGTVEALARILVLNDSGEIEQGSKDLAQIRLERPVTVVPGERFIIRSYSPAATIGGGRVLHGLAKKLKRKDVANAVELLISISGSTGSVEKIGSFIETAGEKGLDFAGLQARTGWRREILDQAITPNLANGTIKKAGSIYIDKISFDQLKLKTIAVLAENYRRQPLSAGISRETVRKNIFGYLSTDIYKAVVTDLENEQKIVIDKDLVRPAGNKMALSAEDSTVRDRILEIYKTAGNESPRLEDTLAEAIKNSKIDRGHARFIFQSLLNAGEIVKISEEFYFPRSIIDGLLAKLTKFNRDADPRLIDVPAFKEIAGVSRKYAIPLLEYFDREKITMRIGDKRRIM
ncbi:MAG: selenocysteine-specific translation elongation factor [Saprospiraceae bacterium]|nr:selenocysteine-specific translation elongation factor [Pyrinomonadaceae bacterium]